MTTGHPNPADVTRLGRAAGFRWPWPRAEELHDHLDIAVSGAWIAYLSDPDATSADILRGAWRELGREYARTRQLPARAATYWSVPQRDEYEEVTERVAAQQVLDALIAEHRDALSLAAELGTTRRVALALDIPEWKARRRVREARQAFSRRWHSPDPPPPLHEIRRDERKPAC